MNRDELEKRNVGENLDTLMNLDPRGYGVCRILYAGSRKATGRAADHARRADARGRREARRSGLYSDGLCTSAA